MIGVLLGVIIGAVIAVIASSRVCPHCGRTGRSRWFYAACPWCGRDR